MQVYMWKWTLPKQRVLLYFCAASAQREHDWDWNQLAGHQLLGGLWIRWLKAETNFPVKCTKWVHLTVQLQALNMKKFCPSFLLFFFSPYIKPVGYWILTALMHCACPLIIFFIVLYDWKEWRWLVTPWSVEKLNIITPLPKLTCRTSLTDHGLCSSFSSGKWYLEYFCTLEKSYIQIHQFYKYLRHHSDYEHWKLIAQSQLAANWLNQQVTLMELDCWRPKSPKSFHLYWKTCLSCQLGLGWNLPIWFTWFSTLDTET